MLLSTYLWVISFDAATSLATVGAASGDEYANIVVHGLSNFSSIASSTLGVTLELEGTVSALPRTRVPTTSPTSPPQQDAQEALSSSPSMSPSSLGQSTSHHSATSMLTGAPTTASIAVGSAVALFLLLGICFLCRMFPSFFLRRAAVEEQQSSCADMDLDLEVHQDDETMISKIRKLPSASTLSRLPRSIDDDFTPPETREPTETSISDSDLETHMNSLENINCPPLYGQHSDIEL